MQLNDLFEGRHDPNIFKAIFMAGGPGAGKSHIAKSLRGATGLKYINVDSFVEMMAPRYGVDIKDPKLYSGEFYRKTRELRDKKRVIGIQNRLGLLLDSTARTASRIIQVNNDLQSIGYHTAMVYVYADVETAKERNDKRDRRVSEKYLRDSHNQSRDNLHIYRDVFGLNLILLDNSGPHNAEHKDYINDQHKMAWKKIRRFLAKENPTATEFRKGV